MNIRAAVPADYNNIYELVQVAFQTARVSDGTEQDFVLALRGGKTYLPALEFVAEQERELIGHIMMTRQKVQTKQGEREGVLVAPLCVALAHRNQGVGASLLYHACQCAIEQGYTIAFLVGDPGYYGRFGYRPVADYGLQNQSEIPDQYVLAKELVCGAWKGIQGVVTVA